MKFRLVGQIYVYSIENWILVSYQAPKQRPRSCQKDMVQCPKNTVLKLKVTTGWFSMVFQLFHGPGIPVWSPPIPEQQHRAVGRRAVLRSSSCLRPGRAAWHGFGRDQPPRETSWNMVFSPSSLSLTLSPHRLRFFTLVSPGDLAKLAEVWIFIHFRATKAICAGSNVSQPGLLPGFPHVSPPWAKHATRPPRPWRVEPVNCLNRSCPNIDSLEVISNTLDLLVLREWRNEMINIMDHSPVAY